MSNVDEFWNFLGAWFPDSDLEGVESDDEVVLNFLRTENASKIKQVYLGGQEVLAMKDLPVQHISEEANRYFETASECREWLQRCLSILSQEKTA
jgi:hypothetical protein